MGVGTFVAGDEVEGFPLPVTVIEFDGALPVYVDGEYDEPDEKRAVEGTEEVSAGEYVLQQRPPRAGRTRWHVGAMGGRRRAEDWLLCGATGWRG
jgi:hypothetical protein